MTHRLLHMIAALVLAITAGAATPPEKAVVLSGIDEDSMRTRLSETDLQPLEGLWYYPTEQMTLAIEKTGDSGSHAESYRLIMIESPDTHLLPGTVIGYAEPSVVSGKFRLWLYTQRDRTTLLHPMECVATLSSDAGALTFEQPKWKVKVRLNLARFLPSIFRTVSISPEKEKETLPEGFKKVYPANDGNGNSFNKIIYL